MHLLQRPAALLFMLLLIGCAHAPPSPDFPVAILQDPACRDRVAIPEGMLTDNQIAQLMERLEARGDICAEIVEEFELWQRAR